MRWLTAGVVLSVVMACAAFAADEGGVLPATMEKYQRARAQVELLPGSAAAKYAPETVQAAKASIAAAQEGLKAGNDSQTREAVEKAVLQVTLANVLADERAAAEKTTAVRKELASLEQRLAAILTGKGDKQ